MPDGVQKFKPGQRVTLPDDVGQRLLQLAPGKELDLGEFGFY